MAKPAATAPADDYADLFDEAPPTRLPGRTARDVAAQQIAEPDPNPLPLAEPTGRLAAVGMGLAQGANMNQFARVAADPFFFDPEVRIGRAKMIAAGEPVRKAVQQASDKAERDRPGEYLGGQLGGMALVPSPTGKAGAGAKLGTRAAVAGGKAIVAAGEGALIADGAGGDAKVGGAAGFLASLTASGFGGIAKRLGNKLLGREANRAASAEADALAQAARKRADDAKAAAAAAKSAQASSAPVLSKAAQDAELAAKEAAKAAKAAAKVASPGKERPVLEALAGSVVGGGALSVPQMIQSPDKAADSLPQIGLGLAAGALAPKAGRKGLRIAEAAAARLAKAAGKVPAPVTAAAGAAGAGVRREISPAAGRRVAEVAAAPEPQAPVDDYADLF